MDDFSRTFEVRWSDVDLNGHMRNTAYSEYALDVRVAWLAEGGFGWERLRDLAIGPVLLREEIEYRRELHLGDRIRVDLRALGLSPDASHFQLLHELHRADGKLAARVIIDAAWLDLRARRIAAPPEPLAELLRSAPRAEAFEELPPAGVPATERRRRER